MKRLTIFFIAVLSLVVSANAQLPNGFRCNYSLSGIYDSYGNESTENVAAPMASVMAVTTNFGFIQSSVLLTLNYGFQSSPLSFESYAGMQNGWYIYVQDMGIAGRNLLYVSSDGSTLRYLCAWNGGIYWEYEAD